MLLILNFVTYYHHIDLNIYFKFNKQGIVEEN